MTPGRTPCTVAFAAEHLEIGERTIRRWITARLLTTYKAERGTKKGATVVILQDVIALEARMRLKVESGPRGRLRRQYLEGAAERARVRQDVPA